ncbi:MAG: hypothetical protein ACOYOB_04180 [Myxococcota bacterium]
MVPLAVAHKSSTRAAVQVHDPDGVASLRTEAIEVRRQCCEQALLSRPLVWAVAVWLRFESWVTGRQRRSVGSAQQDA